MPAYSDKPDNKRFGRETPRPRPTPFQSGDQPRQSTGFDTPLRNEPTPGPRRARPYRDSLEREASAAQKFPQDRAAVRSDRPFERNVNEAPRFRQDRPAQQNDRPFQREPSASPKFRQDRPAPRTAENSEDYNEPQKAVGGIGNVESLLKNKPGLVHRVLFLKDSGDKRLYELQKKVKHLHIHLQQLEASLLDEQAPGNQGVVALCHEREVSSWEAVRQDLFAALESGTPKTVAVIINIEDPRNLGACLRSAHALGVDVVLIPSKGMCGLTPLAARASAGALSQLTMCRPDNLEGALNELVTAGYALLGLDSDTPLSIHDAKFSAHTIIAVGGEDRDLPPFIRKQCTQVLRIPMTADAHSYNASVALTLALYERARSIEFQGMLVDADTYAAKQLEKRAAFAKERAAREEAK